MNKTPRTDDDSGLETFLALMCFMNPFLLSYLHRFGHLRKKEQYMHYSCSCFLTNIENKIEHTLPKWIHAICTKCDPDMRRRIVFFSRQLTEKKVGYMGV